MRKVLLIDVDGVACDHAKGICDAINKEYGTNFCTSDVVKWDFEFHGVTTFVKATEKYYPRREFLLALEVMQGLKEFLKKASDDLEVKFATTRKPYTHESTRTWVRSNLGTQYELLFAQNLKTELPFDFLIDDNYEEVISAAKMGRRAFLFVRPWNNTDDILAQTRNHSLIDIINTFGEALPRLCNG